MVLDAVEGEGGDADDRVGKWVDSRGGVVEYCEFGVGEWACAASMIDFVHMEGMVELPGVVGVD